MSTIEDLEKEIQKIKQRNNKVEVDKAWETSFTRRLLLATFTYIAIGFYLQTINLTKPWISAIVPTIGFLLSTLTLSYFKKVWKKYIFKY